MYRGTLKIFSTKEIQFEKFLAMPADSANTMCGWVTALETKFQTMVAPHLIDVNGESHEQHIVMKPACAANF